MKPVLNWIKAHWMIVASVAVILIVLPAGYVGSSIWNDAIRSAREREGKAKLDEVNNAKVTYAAPTLSPEGKALELSKVAPNQRLTEFFKQQSDKVRELGESVVKNAEQFNRYGRKPLVDGLFPKAANVRDENFKGLEMAQLLVGDPLAGRPSAYQKLLDEVRAGPPADPRRVYQSLKDAADREIEKNKGAGGGDANRSKEEQEKLTAMLVNLRRDQYLRSARSVSVYGTMDCFPGGGGAAPTGPESAGVGGILRVVPPQPPSVAQCFGWQWDYWLLQDVMNVIRVANAGPDGTPRPVPDAVVKRIGRISFVDAVPGTQPTAASPTGEAPPAPAAPAALTSVIAPDFAHSITGRKISLENPLYDIRRVKVSLVVSSARLPELLNAIGRANFLSVLDLDLSEVDMWADLEQGYYYGEESVVRADLELETIWLRSWTTPYMPADVRAKLGLPPIEEPKPADSAANPAAAPQG